MKKIEYSDGIRSMFKTAIKLDEACNDDLDRYQHCYHRYFGVGHHLYLLTNEEVGEDVLAVCDRRNTNIRHLAPEVANLCQDFRLVLVDHEMGGMEVKRG